MQSYRDEVNKVMKVRSQLKLRRRDRRDLLCIAVSWFALCLHFKTHFDNSDLSVTSIDWVYCCVDYVEIENERY